MKTISIIIISHNSEDIILDCLKHCYDEEFDIFLVDNKSEDETISLVCEKYPKVKILAQENNLGYGRAVNEALKACDTKFALLINPDVIASSKDIKKLVAEHRKHLDVAISSTLIQTPDENGEMKIDYVTPIEEGEKVNFVPRVLGAAMMFNMDLLRDKIGFFDENIFMYYEDDELCYRTKKQGYKIVIFSNIKFTHLAGKSSKLDSHYKKVKAWHITWSKLYYRRLSRGYLSSLKLSFAFIIRFLLRSIVSLFTFKFEQLTLNALKLDAALGFVFGVKAFHRRSGKARYVK